MMKLDPDKKLREKKLIEDFMEQSTDFVGWEFDGFSENPDLVYRQGEELLGFESIVVTEDQAAVDCYFDAAKCQLSLRQLGDDPELLGLATEVLVRNLFKHIRRYTIPTVLVFTVMNDEIDLSKLAEHFVLPQFEEHNIRDYYLVKKGSVLKVSESVKPSPFDREPLS